MRSLRAQAAIGIFLAATLGVGSSMAAADGDEDSIQRIHFWRELYAGMSKKELKAAYPKWKAEISEDCPVKVMATFKKDRLISLILLGQDKLAPCTDRIRADLTEKHGQGVIEHRVQGSSLATSSAIFLKETAVRDYVWQLQGYSIRLAIMPGGVQGYNLIFTTRTDGKLY